MAGVELNPSEILSLVLCLLILLYLGYNRKTLLTGKYAYITYGFFCVVAGYFLTNLEEFFLPDVLNVMEHAFSAAGAFLVAVGSHRLLPEDETDGDTSP